MCVCACMSARTYVHACACVYVRVHVRSVGEQYIVCDLCRLTRGEVLSVIKAEE